MENEEIKDPLLIRTARWFILLDGLVWLVFAIIVALDAHTAIPESETIRWVMVGGALLTSGTLIVLDFLLGKASRLVYVLTLGLLLFLALLTIMDEFGVADFVVLILHSVPLVMLLKERRWFLQP